MPGSGRTGERRPRRLVAICAVLVTIVTLASCSGTATPGSNAGSSNPFFTNRFHTTVNPYTFGQDPSWAADGRVLSNKDD